MSTSYDYEHDPLRVPDDSVYTAEGDATVLLGPSRSRASGGARERDALKTRLLSGAGASIGRFIVVRHVGDGGMGMVFAAYDEELDRKVALKLLRRDKSADAHGRDRMLREAQALAKLSHPNVVQVYDVGEFEELVFVAMEFLEGRTLRQWMRAGEHPTREVLEVFLQAGRGLAAAHGVGLVHRDFKPNNVIIGADGRVRVLDFGLAHAEGATPEELREGAALDPDPDRLSVSSSSGAASASLSRSLAASSSLLSRNLTVTGALIGTPAYMSPEQFLGAAADARSDQFSFCVALYEALYGVRPWRARTVLELKRLVCAGQLPEPPRGASVPRWVRRVLARGLSAKRDDRFPSMEALLSALERDPVRARARAGLGLALAGVLIGGGYGLARLQQLEASSCDDAGAPISEVWSDARAAAVETALLELERSLASETWERLGPRLDDYADAWARQRVDACAAHRRGEQSPALFDRRMLCLERRRVELAALVERLLHVNAEILTHALQAADGLPSLARCSDGEALMRAVPPPEDPATAAEVERLRGRLAEARVATTMRQLDDGLKVAREVLAAAESLSYRPLEAEALTVLGRLQSEDGHAEEAAKTLTEAVWVADAVRDDELLATTLASLVFVLGEELRRYEDARRWRRHSEAIVERLGEGARGRARLSWAFGTLMNRVGEYDEAQALLEEALAIDERLFGPGDQRVTNAITGLGNLFFLRGDLERARRFYERSAAISEEQRGPHHPIFANNLSNLASVLATSGELEEAQKLLERSLAIDEEAHGLEHPALESQLGNLGAVLAMQGKLAEARVYFERGLAISARVRGPRSEHLVVSLLNLGNLTFDEADYEASRRHLERALSIADETQAPSHRERVDVMGQLAMVALAQERVDEAIELLERALKLRRENPETARAGQQPLLQWRLAKALTQRGADARRARGLAAEALAGFKATDAARFNETIEEIQTWLDEQEKG